MVILLNHIFGILLEVNNINYFVPVSSPKNKHKNLSNDIDLFKIMNFDNTYNFGVLNINNMIPIPNFCINKLKYEDIKLYRKFDSDRQKENYIALLKREINIIKKNEKIIKENALKLYNIVTEKKSKNLVKRSCNFKLLEEKCIEYQI